VTAPEPRVWVTEIGYPPASNGPLHILHSPMPPPEPLPDPVPDPEPEAEL
jgi:hypothetical protein